MVFDGASHYGSQDCRSVKTVTEIGDRTWNSPASDLVFYAGLVWIEGQDGLPECQQLDHLDDILISNAHGITRACPLSALFLSPDFGNLSPLFVKHATGCLGNRDFPNPNIESVHTPQPISDCRRIRPEVGFTGSSRPLTTPSFKVITAFPDIGWASTQWKVLQVSSCITE